MKRTLCPDTFTYCPLAKRTDTPPFRGCPVRSVRRKGGGMREGLSFFGRKRNFGAILASNGNRHGIVSRNFKTGLG
jgi:hypothetical protein